jgi:hypothetical protein
LFKKRKQKKMARAITLDSQYPPTPRMVPEEFAGMAHVIRHNAATPYGQDPRYGPPQSFMGSDQGTNYSTPSSSQWGHDNATPDQNGSEYGYSYPEPGNTNVRSLNQK